MLPKTIFFQFYKKQLYLGVITIALYEKIIFIKNEDSNKGS
jgi:hypothetical protein